MPGHGQRDTVLVAALRAEERDSAVDKLGRTLPTELPHRAERHWASFALNGACWQNAANSILFALHRRH